VAVNEQKYLVTWIHADGSVNGQATKTVEDAERMFNHLKNSDAQYIEVRRIGRVVMQFGTDQGKPS
jgi:hypothetical protein